MKLSGTFIVAWSSFALHVVLFPAILVASESHPHTGKVKPFKSGDPGVKINSKASAVLQQGKPYQTQIKDGSGKGGRGLVVQDVDAPTDVVWDRILDFDKYDKMVPKTYESQTYKSLSKGKMKEIWVRMKVGFPVYKITFYVHHWYEPSKNSMTWTLDYSKKSEIDDSCGYWYVVPHPDDPKHRTRVYYSVEVAMFPWVPKMLTDFMSKQALTDAVRRNKALAFNINVHGPIDNLTSCAIDGLGQERK